MSGGKKDNKDIAEGNELLLRRKGDGKEVQLTLEPTRVKGVVGGKKRVRSSEQLQDDKERRRWRSKKK